MHLGQKAAYTIEHVDHDAVQGTNQPTQHPNRDGQRQPHQQSGEYVLFKIHDGLRKKAETAEGGLSDKHKRGHKTQRWRLQAYQQAWPLAAQQFRGRARACCLCHQCWLGRCSHPL